MTRPDPVPGEAGLIAGSAGGDAEAFSLLVTPYRAWLLRTAELLLTDPGEAEDAVQETLVAALRGLPEFRGDSAFSTWLCGILINQCRHARRRRVRNAANAGPEFLEAQPARAGRQNGALSALLRREVHERVADAVARLPLPLREAFLLRAIHGMEYSDVAAAAGVSLETARVRVFRARELLRAELGDLGGLKERRELP
jgi:RNA polymerase sigma-70 factor (ECF subfamily)